MILYIPSLKFKRTYTIINYLLYITYALYVAYHKIALDLIEHTGCKRINDIYG